MRFSTVLLALIPATVLAAPIPAPAPGFLDSIGDLLKKIPVVGAVTDAIQRPELLTARLDVATGLDQAKAALKSIVDETTNADVRTTSETALDDISQAQSAVKSILNSILTSTPPERSDQATVAQHVSKTKDLIGTLASELQATPGKLSNDINDATDGINRAAKGTQKVLDISGLSPADVGLNGRLV